MVMYALTDDGRTLLDIVLSSEELTTSRSPRRCLSKVPHSCSSGPSGRRRSCPSRRLGLRPADRSTLERRARILAWGGIAWHVVEFAIAIAAGVAAGSIALIGFGADSLIEAIAGFVVLWLFTGSRRGSRSAERRAQQLIAATFFVLAAYVGIEATRALAAAITRARAGSASAWPPSRPLTMPLLARAKRQRRPRKLSSSAAVKEASQTSLCAYLSIALLIGLGRTRCSAGGGPTRWLHSSSPPSPSRKAASPGEARAAPTAAASGDGSPLSRLLEAVKTTARPSRAGSCRRGWDWGSADSGVDRENNLSVCWARTWTLVGWGVCPNGSRVCVYRVDPRRKPDPVGALLIRSSPRSKACAREREDDVGGGSVTGDAFSADRRHRAASHGSVIVHSTMKPPTCLRRRRD